MSRRGFVLLNDEVTASTSEIVSHSHDSVSGGGSNNSSGGMTRNIYVHVATNYLIQQYREGNFTLFFAWVVWIAVGTVFYAEYNFAGDYAKGFFYSVNVGYSIGWGILGDYSDGCKLFSIGYIIVGAVFATRAIVSLAENAVKENETVHEQLLMRRILKRQTTLRGLAGDYYVWAVMSAGRFFVVYIWLLYLFVGTAWSCWLVNWSLVDGVYFSLSSMSTGGLYSFPEESPDEVYVLTGLYAALGVPLMALAVANIATLVVEAHRIEALRLRSRVVLSDRDVDVLRAMRFDVDLAAQRQRQALDRHQFLVLMLCKRGLLRQEDVSAIVKEYDDLKCDAEGRVAYQTLFDQNILTERRTKLDEVRDTVKEMGDSVKDAVKEQGIVVLNVLHSELSSKDIESH